MRPPERPLDGVRVLLTRPRQDVREMQSQLEALGARVHCLPTIAIEPLVDSPESDEALSRLDRYDWIAFTSRNAVRAVFRWLDAHDRPFPSSVRSAVVGPGTADELRSRGVTPSVLPSAASGTALARAMQAAGVAGTHVLLPIGNLAKPDLRLELEAAGALVTSITVYATSHADPAGGDDWEMLRRHAIDVIAFASPSSFVNLEKMLQDGAQTILTSVRLVAIGPTTAEAMRAAGHEPHAVASQQTRAGLVEAIVQVCNTEGR